MEDIVIIIDNAMVRYEFITRVLKKVKKEFIVDDNLVPLNDNAKFLTGAMNPYSEKCVFSIEQYLKISGTSKRLLMKKMFEMSY